jgi:ABC-type phosphate/phosphonate transport system substrate-binding protein
MRLPIVKLVLVVALVALLGAGMVSTTTSRVVAQGEIGTRGNPITWLFPPSTQPATVEEIAGKIAEDLSEMTGYFIKPLVAADYAALIEAMIVAEGDTMGVPTTDQYCQITEDNPGVHARLAAVRYGYPYYFSSFYALREKGFESIQDFNGNIWIYNDPGSTSGYKIPFGMLGNAGVVVGGTVESGGHTNSMVALIEGQGDFCTAYGSPPLPPDRCLQSCGAEFKDCILVNSDVVACVTELEVCEEACATRWEYGMYPDLWLWDRWGNELLPELLRGSCVDARLALAGTDLYGDIWEIVEKIGIVDVVGPIPNDSIAFAAGFPTGIEDQLVQAILSHIRSPEGQELWGDPNFYEWTDAEEIDDSYYDNYRAYMGYPVPER